MSLWRDELKPSVATLGSLLVLTCIAVASLSRVIQAPGYLFTAIAAIVIGAAFAFFFGQRSLGLGFALLVVLTFLTLPALFLRGPKASLLPTGKALSALKTLIRTGFDGISRATPPVPAQARFLVLVWVALLLLGFLGAAWIVVRRPVGAVVSAIAVVTFGGSVGDGAGRNLYAVAAIAATIAFLLSEGRQRIQRWGGGGIVIPPWLGVPTLAFACAAALAAPFVLGDNPILKLNSALRPRVVIIKPLSDIKRQLKVDPPLEVMRVQATRPTYWRLTGLDSYDGREWVLEAHPRDLFKNTVPQAKPPTTGDILQQQYTLTSLLSPWMPAAYSAVTVDTNEPAQIDLGSQTLLLRDKTQPGLTYSVTSRLPDAAVNQAANLKPSDDPTEAMFGNIAKPIVAGARTPLDMAQRLETNFRTFTYDEDVPAGHTVARLQQFLAAKRGYCEQFAATMTLELRGLGIESRVGVGFLPGAFHDGSYIVSTKDAHAWVEANMPGIGWMSFDPTPGRGDASSVTGQNKQQLSTPQPIPQPTTVPEPTPVRQDQPQDVTPVKPPSRVPVVALWTLLGIVVVGFIPGAKLFRRSRRRRGTPSAVVAGAYTELLDTARDLGWHPRESETHREFVLRTLDGVEAASGLALLVARAVYGPSAPDAAAAASAWKASGAARSALRKRTSWWRRAIAIFDPRTLITIKRRGLRLRVAPARS